MSIQKEKNQEMKLIKEKGNINKKGKKSNSRDKWVLNKLSKYS